MDLDSFFSAQIPLTRAMGLRVAENTVSRLALAAPLAPNRNDKGTAFAGSIAALATLAGAAYTLTLIDARGVDADVVIARSEQEYLRPAKDDLSAICVDPGAAQRRRFLDSLAATGTARWWLGVSVISGGREAARLQGEYVGLMRAARDDGRKQTS